MCIPHHYPVSSRSLAPLALALLLAACDGGDGDVIRSVDLRPGARLTYASTFFESDSLGHLRPVLLDTLTVRVLGEGRAVLGETGLTEVAVTSRRQGSGRSWYREDDDALRAVAYATTGVAELPLAEAPRAGPPDLPHLVRLRLGALGEAAGRTHAPADTLLRDTPRTVVVYPLVEGQTWEHYDLFGDGSFRSTREVLGYEEVATPAGRFRCAVVRTRIFMGGQEITDLDWRDWVAEAGVVRRRIESESPTTAGTVRLLSEEALIAVE